MLYWLLPPQSSQVAEYVECYWMIEKTAASQGEAFPKLNPDAAAHCILTPDDQIYRYTHNTQTLYGTGSHWLFPHHSTYALDHSQPFIYIGIKFHIGALYALEIPHYTHPSLDQAQPLNDDASWLDRNTLSSLFTLAREHPQQCAEQLDAMLLPWLSLAKPDRHSQWVRKVLPLLDTMPITALGDAVFCSQRTLERSFSRVTGLTLKQCQSINKLDAMLEYLYQREASEIDWAAVAMKFGFSDQPHLTRYLKSQLGITPKTYANKRGLTIDVYGGVHEMQKAAK